MSWIIAILFITLIYAPHLSAADPIVKRIQAIRTDTPPLIDGELDDGCWQKAAKVSDLIQFQPSKGKPPTHAISAYLLYDLNKLYVAFECIKDGESVHASITRRDQEMFQDDHFAIFLDTFHDRRNCYAFMLNPLSAQTDKRIANEGAAREERRGGGRRGDPSTAWDCEWQGKASKTENGWSAEMAIPFAELRYDTKNDGIWGINFWANDEVNDEEISWVDLGSSRTAVSKFGNLVGLPVKDLVAKRPLELKPYATVKPQKASEFETKPDAGLDVRYPFSNATIDLTLNPDFAQIEADPEQVNLTDIPLRFPEKRPFFQEGAELYDMPLELFYSRRIEELVFGSKMIGKIGKYNYSVIDSQSKNSEFEDIDEEDEEERYDNDANYFVSRIQRDVGVSSSIGFIGVNKQKTAGGYNRSAGLDGSFSLPKGAKLLTQFAKTWSPGIGNREQGTGDSIKNDQNDQNDQIDSNAFMTRIVRDSRRLSFDLRYMDVGENFEVESGFIPRINRRGASNRVEYNYQLERRLPQRLRASVEYERLTDQNGKRTNERRGFNGMIGGYNVFLFGGPDWYYHFNYDYDEGDEKPFTDKTFRLFLGWFPPKWLNTRNLFFWGTVDDQKTFLFSPSVEFYPTDKLRFEMEIQRVTKDQKLEDLNRRFAIGYQFAQRMFLRSTFEFTKHDERRFFAIYSYEYKPESNFFVVYNDNTDAEGKRSQILFIKVAHQIKIGNRKQETGNREKEN